ncbi:MAG: M20/M25/M40 family metallo-hydrolase, partial [Sedimentisphaerales bacterium]|nr:M20/M25/M40 family metallo-hydrolase [Sedimentisphaerales bacterium]
EEYDMAGSKYCATRIGSQLSGVVIGEPTELNVIVAHKGVVRLSLTSRGISGHSSMPHHFQNAIYPMARTVTTVKEFADELTQRPAHPKLGTETLSVTIVNGGYQINIIPESCQAQIDWRILPGRTPRACRDELAQYLADKITESIEVELLNAYEPMDTPPDHDLVKALLTAAQKTGAQSTTQAVAYATDASAFNTLSVPTPIFGPGQPNKAHTRDEYIEIDQLEKGLFAYKSFLENAGRL